MGNIKVITIMILLLFTTQIGSQYTNGDIRLYLNGSTSLNHTIGVLEIFLNNRWGTVCGDEFNIGSAAAACRQLGFLKALRYGSPQDFNLQIPAQLNPILTQVTCNADKNNNYAIIGELHLLRCPHKIMFVNACSTIQDVVALRCDPALLVSDPYEGQLRLVDGNVQSTGLLEIYLHNQWGTVCSQDFNDAAANSVCRQLGYTNAINISHGSGLESSPVWIDSTHCDSSHSCFSTTCISYPHSPVTSGPCASHTLDVIVNCTFDSTDSDRLLPGNYYICTITELDVLVIILSVVFGTVFFAILCITIVCICCCFSNSACPLYAYRAKRKYEGLI